VLFSFLARLMRDGSHADILSTIAAVHLLQNCYCGKGPRCPTVEAAFITVRLRARHLALDHSELPR